MVKKKSEASKKPPVKSSSKIRGTIEQRESIRFQPDPGTLAQVDLVHLEKTAKFEPTLQALVTEESHRGCGLVLKMTKELQVGSVCRVKVGHAPPLKAEVRWRVELDSQIIRIGLMLLE